MPTKPDAATRKARSASRSALAINRALDHLHAALVELDQAHTHALTRGARLDASSERAIYARLSNALTVIEEPGGSIIGAIRALRDRRAKLAGFTFE